MDRYYASCFGKLFLIILIASSNSWCQKKFGNEWIDTTQNYLRIPVVQTGFYQVTFSELKKAGFPVNISALESLQLFRRGQEVAIEIKKDSDSLGFLSFYGEKNDGALDSSLYVTPKDMPHTYYSLYSDTASYFLTYRNDGKIGERIAVSAGKATQNVIPYHFEEILQIRTDEYPAGNLYPMGSTYENGTVLTTYDTGEGWTGKELQNNQSETFRIALENPFIPKPNQTEIEVLIVGRSAGNHQILFQTGEKNTVIRTLDTLRLLDYNSAVFKFLLNSEGITANGNLAFTLSPINNSGSVSLSYLKFRYPQRTSLPSALLQKTYHFDPDIFEKAAIFRNSQNWQFYDCTNPYETKKLIPEDSLLFLNGAEKVIAFKEFLKVPLMRLAKFKSINPKTDFLIISHPLVRNPIPASKDPVQEYADYRASKEGGNFNTLILNSEEIFDQFNYGEPGPLGIRNVISFLQEKASLKFVLILGKSIDPQTARHQLKARQNDMIPNAGWPGSDMALTMGLDDPSTYVPLVPIGRVNAATSQNVFDYLQKVKTFESQNKAASWRKNILHLSGGHTANEREVFRQYVESFEKRISSSSLGANVLTLSKKTDEPVELFPIDTIVNNGVALMTLYGHSGLNSNDIDIGSPADTKRTYKNAPFYPAILVNGCAMGNVYYSTPGISNDWILSPEKGAVLFVAHTHNGVTSSLKHYTDAFYEVLADSLFVSESFGIMQQEAIRRNMKKYPTLSDGITAQQMNLLGDPAIKIFPAKLPDYTWNGDQLHFSDPTGRVLTNQSDSVNVKIGIRNNGRFKAEKYEIVIHRNNGNSSTTYQIPRNAPAYLDTLSITLPNKNLKSGPEKWSFTIDPANLLQEENKANNYFETTFLLPESNEEKPATISDAGVSPNPSREHFRFFLTFDGLVLPEKWTIKVFDILGRTVYQKDLQPFLGKNEHIWRPGNIPVGMYLYQMVPDKNYVTSRAKVKKLMSGKLIWMH
ncbi:C25 family cysteine peptidase [Dyadobacter sp. CY345]|uniref:putative type IX secretion system sortase PorU2 n=1 Tax=Dyadobacter sp. CY345 TaxID=2909335 RepID=UPI001F29AF58|nr:C25 family cysteine peptidase [Dyadobacter sp. CY345]MCF2445462.1 C25 family cysteine peptidase [Dyadobacter sp. CY345]